MKFRFSFFFALLVFPFLASAQQLEKFSEDPSAFLKELEGLMTASKNPKLEELFKGFEKSFKGGVFTADEITRIRQTGDKMLAQRMTANPYFTAYLTALSLVKKTELGETRFKTWHEVLDGMLGSIENRKLKPFEEFLDFSAGFFEKNALRKSDLGTTWIARASRYDLVFEDKKPLVKYDKLDLIATRGKDSIMIKATAGVYSPVEEIWKGKGGTVSWERLGLKSDVFAELGEYEFESKKSLYEVKSAKLHYPLYFGQKAIEGKFEDKLVTQNEATEGSYPRFESNERVLELKNIGEGVQFKGGFRLQGTTVYGFGNRKERAELKLYNKKNTLVYKGQSELFTIKQEERIVGEGVESSVYFGTDSLFHPSVNMRYELKKKELQLARGKRGSDRNPFYNSLHQINIDVELVDYLLQSDSIYIGRRNVGMSKSAAATTFESLKFFNENDYNRLQNISTTNPIAIMKVAYQESGERFINAESLAKRLNPKFSVENINSLLYDLVSKGFINYNADDGIVEMKDKVLHYAEASQKKVDYDNLRIASETNETNGVFDLKDNSISVNGVKNLEFSHTQKVGLLPHGENIRLKGNRDMDFDGKMFAGLGVFDGKDFHFDYNKFHVSMDSVRYFDLYLPTGKVDKDGNLEAYSLASRVEHLSGVLLVDAPANKSGRETIEMFPSLESKKSAFIFYDYKKTQGGVYERDSFFFKLNPFSFNSLDKFTKDAIHFKGKMHTTDIFPVFDETAVVREDTSLGFVTKTPEKGFANYRGKGQYFGAIDMSNKGLLGKGTLNYLGAKIDSEDFIFKPQQLTGSAERFVME
ncbi:MAG: hypothetical protein MUC59_15505, partial [Saprospiraceae bacterium]|nr:hypothetical protein [Saprospiraceae bacterium]